MSDDVQTVQMDYADAMEMLYRQQQTIKRLRKALRPFATAKVNRTFPQSPIYHLNYLEKDGDPFENAIAALGETD